jgi:hypothetical protein
MVHGEIETISTHRLILKELSIVTTFPRIVSHKTFINKFSLSDFDIVVGSFSLILDKIVFFAAFYGSEYLLFT